MDRLPGAIAKRSFRASEESREGARIWLPRFLATLGMTAQPRHMRLAWLDSDLHRAEFERDIRVLGDPPKRVSRSIGLGALALGA